MMNELDYEKRVGSIMPSWTFWGEGIVLVNKKQWYKSRDRILAILKQMHKTKKRIKELERAAQEANR